MSRTIGAKEDKPRNPPRSPGPAWPRFLAAHATLLARVEARLKAAELPELAWYDALWALERAPEARLRMHELADALVVPRSSLTRLVDRLEAGGLVARMRGGGDRRGAYATLTPAGRALRARMWPVYREAIVELFDAHLTAAENAAMAELLERLIAAARPGSAEAPA